MLKCMCVRQDLVYLHFSLTFYHFVLHRVAALILFYILSKPIGSIL